MSDRATDLTNTELPPDRQVEPLSGAVNRSTDAGSPSESGEAGRPEASIAESAKQLVPEELCEWLSQRGMRATIALTDSAGGPPPQEHAAALKQWVAHRDECFQQQQSLSALGELSASVVHETRNAMAGVLGLAQLHQSDGGPDTATMDLIAQEATRCTELLSSFLTVAAGSSLPLQLITLGDVLYPVRKLTAPRAKATRVAVSYHFSENSSSFLGHGGELRQILLNLVLNAVQAVAVGGKVEVRASLEGGDVVLRVDDDGPGITTELASRIFEPFFSTRLGAGGTGLGLPTSRTLARRRGGDLWSEVSPLGGASFVVRLPRIVPRPGGQEPAPPAARRPAGSDG